MYIFSVYIFPFCLLTCLPKCTVITHIPPLHHLSIHSQNNTHTPTNTSTYIENTTTLYTKITLQATSCPVPSNINTHWLKRFNSTTSFISFCFLKGVHIQLHSPFLLIYLSTWGMYTFTHLSPFYLLTCLPHIYSYIYTFSLLTCLPEVCTLTFPPSPCLPVYLRCVHLHPLSPCLPVYLKCVHLHLPFPFLREVFLGGLLLISGFLPSDPGVPLHPSLLVPSFSAFLRPLFSLLLPSWFKSAASCESYLTTNSVSPPPPPPPPTPASLTRFFLFWGWAETIHSFTDHYP